jgi:hypothetical protein
MSLGAVAAAERLDALVAPSLHYVLRATGNEAEVPRLRAAGVRLFSLDYAFETVTSDPLGYTALDVTFYTSEFQRALHWRLMADRFAALPAEVDCAARSAVCGSTMTDQLRLVDRDAARARFGVRAGQRVVVLMTLKMDVPDPWRRLVWGGGPAPLRIVRAWKSGRSDLIREIRGPHGYRELVQALLDLCCRENAVLIVKSREKNRDPWFVRRSARFVVDDDVYPYTSIQLMAIADLCVHFQSGAVLEAAAAGVPSLSVAVSQAHLETYTSLDDVYGMRPESLQNFPGIVWPVEGRDAGALVRGASLEDFRVERTARRRYVEKFLGFDDTQSSRRVLERMEDVVRG